MVRHTAPNTSGFGLLTLEHFEAFEPSPQHARGRRSAPQKFCQVTRIPARFRAFYVLGYILVYRLVLPRVSDVVYLGPIKMTFVSLSNTAKLMHRWRCHGPCVTSRDRVHYEEPSVICIWKPSSSSSKTWSTCRTTSRSLSDPT